MAKYPRRATSSAAGNGLGTMIKYLRQTTSGAAGNGLGSKVKYLCGAAGIGLGITIKYLRRITRQRPGHRDQVPATHNGRCREQRPEPIPGITDLPVHQEIHFWLSRDLSLKGRSPRDSFLAIARSYTERLVLSLEFPSLSLFLGYKVR
jgi:hypothetical protein